MVTQSEHFEQQKRLKKRNQIINDELAICQGWAVGALTQPMDKETTLLVAEIAERIYHLGMDTGIRIGKEEI